MMIFHTAALLVIVSSWALVVAAALGLWLAPTPIWLGRSLTFLSFMLLASSSIVAHDYAMELFIAYYSANAYEWATFQLRFTGIYAVSYWLLIGSSLVPQLLWFRRFRCRPWPALLIALAAAIPPTIERVISARAP